MRILNPDLSRPCKFCILFGMSRVCFLLPLHATLFRLIAGACYFRNGTQQPDIYSPCSSDASKPLSTVCCASSWDICLPNGLCQSTTGDRSIWREGCTKQKWNEGGCQELCSDEVGYYLCGVLEDTDTNIVKREAQRNDNIRVTPCSGNATSLEWCCGQSADCCSAGSDLRRYTIARIFGDPIPKPSPSSGLPSSSPSAIGPSASTSVALPLASESTSPSQRVLSTGEKAGIGLGASLGVVCLVALVVFIWKALQWRRRARAAAVLPAYEMPEGHKPAGADIYRYRGSFKAAELAEVEGAAHELPHFPEPLELCSSPRL